MPTCQRFTGQHRHEYCLVGARRRFVALKRRISRHNRVQSDLTDDASVKHKQMTVRLTKKFSELIDDVNLAKFRVGDVIKLPARDAHLLVAERWASAIEEPTATANDKPRQRGPR